MSGGDYGARGACATCHGIKGEGDGDRTPALAGLDPGYLAGQLNLYADGLRAHPQMHAIARSLDRDEQLAVANIMARCRPSGDALTVPHRTFSTSALALPAMATLAKAGPEFPPSPASPRLMSRRSSPRGGWARAAAIPRGR